MLHYSANSSSKHSVDNERSRVKSQGRIKVRLMIVYLQPGEDFLAAQTTVHELGMVLHLQSLVTLHVESTQDSLLGHLKR